MKKRGKRHGTLAVVPLGMKRNRYALDAHAALLALENGCGKESHLIDLYCLARLCDEMSEEAHIKQHCASISRLCDEIHEAGYNCNDFRYAAMRASSVLLLEWFEKQPNAVIARTAIAMSKRVSSGGAYAKTA